MSAWFQTFGAVERPLARLFCFPHAGGAPAAFRLWPQSVPARVQVVGVQLPGRGSRLREAPLASVPELTARLAAELGPQLDLPYVFFGHSMGAVLALEAAHALASAGQRLPSHVFLSGRRPPHLPRTESDLHTLTDDEFLAQLGARYGGIPAEVLRERELLALLLPALRADIEALETFHVDASPPLSCALTAYGGDDDPLVTLEQLRAWRQYTRGAFRVRQFRGGHFYLQERRAEIAAEISAVLSALIAPAAPGQMFA